jgi:hypothetical protein
MPPTLLDSRELSAKIGARQEDILSWHRRGIIPSIKAGGRVYFNLSLVVKALRERQALRQEEVAAC